jgi:hypothetical protein
MEKHMVEATIYNYVSIAQKTAIKEMAKFMPSPSILQ